MRKKNQQAGARMLARYVAIYLYIPGGNDACLRNNDNSLLPCLQADAKKVLSVVL